MGIYDDYLRDPVTRAYAIAMIAAAGRPLVSNEFNWYVADALVRDITARDRAGQPLFLAYQSALRMVRLSPTLPSLSYALLCACAPITFQTVLADEAWVALMPDPADASLDFQGRGRRHFRAVFAAGLVERLWGQISFPTIQRDRDLFQQLRLRPVAPDVVRQECAALAWDLIGHPAAGPGNPGLMRAFDEAFAAPPGGSSVQRMEAVHKPVKGLIEDLRRRR
ncbi:hypothetical protein [Azospirillum rugosum]|uniref:Nucleotidyltransferase n=1 Tax=Azospirillum rugosum TaxID=416170 RepID=A0ABS4SH71_9PROT|nr:hypothetical protein [Azospirillum rugosum]MBP2291800.1 hypothetical protein [Azospirillum rugosum]MDQ0524388.1 hypothetical protein [Azospirillum rugosum]